MKESYTDKEKKDFDDKKNGKITSVPGSGGNSENSGDTGDTDPETPVLTPSLALRLATVSNLGKFNLNVNLSDFVGDKHIYGVEVHLFYGENIAIDDNPMSTLVSNSDIFKPNNSADHIKEYLTVHRKSLCMQ